MSSGVGNITLRNREHSKCLSVELLLRAPWDQRNPPPPQSPPCSLGGEVLW